MTCPCTYIRKSDKFILRWEPLDIMNYATTVLLFFMIVFFTASRSYAFPYCANGGDSVSFSCRNFRVKSTNISKPTSLICTWVGHLTLSLHKIRKIDCGSVHVHNCFFMFYLHLSFIFSALKHV